MPSGSQGEAFDRAPIPWNSATAAAACGAGSLLLLAVPGLIVFALVLGVVAVVLGAVAVGPGRRSGARDGTVARAIAGMVLGGACLVILAGLLVAGLVGGDDGDVVRHVAATAADLQVGDCVVTVRDGSLATVPCDVEHHAEVYAVGAARDAATFPGLATLDRQATEHCDGRLGAYVGSEARARRLAWSTLWPDEPAWADGSRALVCLAVRPDATTMTRSVATS